MTIQLINAADETSASTIVGAGGINVYIDGAGTVDLEVHVGGKWTKLDGLVAMPAGFHTMPIEPGRVVRAVVIGTATVEVVNGPY